MVIAVGFARKALEKWADTLAHAHATAPQPESGEIATWFADVVEFVRDLPEDDPGLQQLAMVMRPDSEALPAGDGLREASRHQAGDDPASWCGRVIAAAISESIDRGVPNNN